MAEVQRSAMGICAGQLRSNISQRLDRETEAEELGDEGGKKKCKDRFRRS